MNTERHPWVGAIVMLFGRNIVTTMGAVLATVSVGGFAILAAMIAFAAIDSPYIGLLLFVMMPALFILGLLLIPLGVLGERLFRRGEKPEHSGRFVVDLHHPRVRRAVFIVIALTVINIVGVSAVSYESIHYMESPAFCGEACHTPMEPEFTAYQHSPHANIHCVDCHVGPGMEWLVRSKLAGVRQLIGVMTDDYSRPVHPPAHEMRNANETCGSCHDPDKGMRNKLVLNQKFAEDEANTPIFSALLMHLGSTNANHSGVHAWHLEPGREVYFLPAEDLKETIPYVRVVEADGSTRHFNADGFEGDGEALPLEKLRRMDCIDCHNRPAHHFDLPATAIDKAMLAGEIPRELPSAKAASLEALVAAGESGSVDDVSKLMRAYYAQNYPELNAEQNAQLDKAVSGAEELFRRNIFPKMNVGWGTYPDHSSHIDTLGCFRCHDDAHKSNDERVISQDCTICHEVLAWDEESSDFITMLNLHP